MASKYLYKVTSAGDRQTMWSPHLSQLLVSICGISHKDSLSKSTSLVRLIHNKVAIEFRLNGIKYMLLRRVNDQATV